MIYTIDGLITRRSVVQIHPPLPENSRGYGTSVAPFSVRLLPFFYQTWILTRSKEAIADPSLPLWEGVLYILPQPRSAPELRYGRYSHCPLRWYQCKLCEWFLADWFLHMQRTYPMSQFHEEWCSPPKLNSILRNRNDSRACREDTGFLSPGPQVDEGGIRELFVWRRRV